jgi:hypothetical protein
MVDLISRNQCGTTGMKNVLRVLEKHVVDHLSQEAADALPLTLHRLTAQAAEITRVGAGCKHFYRHFCPKCGEIFPVDEAIIVCVVDGCIGRRFDRTGKPRQKALYYDFREKLSRLLKDGFLRGFATADLPPLPEIPVGRRHLRDVYDGEIITALRKLWPLLRVIYIAMVHSLPI